MTYEEYTSLSADEKMVARAQSLRNVALTSGFDHVFSDVDTILLTAKNALPVVLKSPKTIAREEAPTLHLSLTKIDK